MNDDPVLAGDETEVELADEDVVYQINTFGADFTVDGLVKRFEKGTIFQPDFQRNFVWTWAQASRFRESILLGLPIPSIFLYREEETQKHLIVDGLQRLTTLHGFYRGKLPDSQRVFTLKGVKSQFEGKSVDDLTQEDQLRLEDTVIHAMIIQQTAPAQDNSAVFHIFERLNSNGTPLQAQEIRAAIYHGPFQEMLAKLNKLDNWRAIFGPEHKRSKDEELILRFLALRHNHSKYKKPMKSFLNDFMRQHRNADDLMIAGFTREFCDAIERARGALGDRAFRPQRSFNVAVFDSFMVALAQHPEADFNAVNEAYQRLSNDLDFMRLCSEATSDEGSVSGRIHAASEALNAAA